MSHVENKHIIIYGAHMYVFAPGFEGPMEALEVDVNIDSVSDYKLMQDI